MGNLLKKQVSSEKILASLHFNSPKVHANIGENYIAVSIESYAQTLSHQELHRMLAYQIHRP